MNNLGILVEISSNTLELASFIYMCIYIYKEKQGGSRLINTTKNQIHTSGSQISLNEHKIEQK